MPLVVPPGYTPLPTPVPQRSDPVNFAPRADAFLTALPGYQAQLDAIGVAAYTNAVSAQDSATVAQDSAANAAASQVAAEAAQVQAAQSAGAPKWVAGNYAEGVVAWSPLRGLVYRRKAPGGASAADPALDPTGWVLAVAAAPLYRPETSAAPVAEVNVEHGLRAVTSQNLVLPLPATLLVGDIVHVRVENGLQTNYLSLNGAKVNGEVQSGGVLVLDDPYAAIQCRWTGLDYGWSI